MTKTEYQNQLKHFYGTEAYHATASLAVKLTDGAKFLRDHGLEAVIDTIVAAQPAIQAKSRPMRSFQVWNLNKTKEGWVLQGGTGAKRGKPSFEAKFESLPDFPLDTMQIYVGFNTPAQAVVLLPSEY